MFDVLPIGAPVVLPLLIQCEVAGRGRIDWLRYAVRCCDFEKYKDWCVAYHGTTSNDVRSILLRGMRRPGDPGVQISHGGADTRAPDSRAPDLPRRRRGADTRASRGASCCLHKEATSTRFEIGSSWRWGFRVP